MDARSYFGQRSRIHGGALALVALSLTHTALADPPVQERKTSLSADASPFAYDFVSRTDSLVASSDEAAFVSMSSPARSLYARAEAVEPAWSLCSGGACAPPTWYHVARRFDASLGASSAPSLDGSARARETIARPSPERATALTFTPLGLALDALGIAGAIGRFDPLRNTTPAAAPRDAVSRAVAGTTFLAMGLPITCIGMWALTTPDAHARPAGAPRDAIPLPGGLALAPEGLRF